MMSGRRPRRERFAPIAAALLAAVLVALAGVLAGCSMSSPVWPEATSRPSQEVGTSPSGTIAHATARAFAEQIHPRTADTWGEIRAREFVVGTFQQYGYEPSLQEFIVHDNGRRLHSANVLVVKEGESAERLVIGAHYDAAAGEGYTDDAVGTGLLMELAARMRALETPYTLVFVAYGAEQRSRLGSRHFVEAMSKVERSAVLGVIDLDAVAGGDELFVYSQPEAATWLRDDILAAAQDLGVELGPPPARGDLMAGTADLPGSAATFVEAGIPAATLTATSWTAGRKDGGTQTSAQGQLRGTARDSVQFVESKFPGRVEAQLADLSQLLEIVLTSRLEKRP